MLIDRKQLRIIIRNALNEAVDAQDAENNNSLEFTDGKKLSVQKDKLHYDGKQLTDITQALKLIADSIENKKVKDKEAALKFASSLMQNAPSDMESYLKNNRFVQSAQS